ncbi:MAG: MFS transporter [Acidimicrobiales bacterium]|nr:MFS transporter [Acidimicrobiales bacterium]
MVLALVGSAVLLATINFALIFVAFDDIKASFDASEATVSWALTGFTITVAAMLIPAGWMADRYGRKTILVLGMSLFTVGSAAVAWSPTVGVLIGGRVVQAAGLGMESSAALALVLSAFGPTRRSSAVGGIGALGGVAAALGPAIGGTLVDAYGWRWTFALNVPLGLIIVVLLATVLRPTAAPQANAGPPDLLGVAGLVVGIGAIALAIVQIETWGLAGWRFWLALLVGISSLAAMITRSRHHPSPILHLPLYRQHDFALGSMLNLVIAGSFPAMFLAWIALFTNGWDMSLSQAGLAIAFIPMIAGPLTFVAGTLADRFGPRAVIVPGCAFMAAAGGFFTVAISAERNIARVWLPGAFLFAVGVGLAHAATHSSAMVTVPEDRLGVGGAMSRIGLDVGGTIWVAFMVALLAAADDPIEGTRQAAVFLTVIGVVGFVAASRLHYRPRAARS